MSVKCQDCDNVESASRKQEWYRWRCLKKHVPRPIQHVVHDPFLTQPPFRLCRDVNHDGECKTFTPQPEPEG